MPLITLNKASLAYGHHPLLEGVEFQIQAEERVGLIGRNGSGKSALLKVIVGKGMLDDGLVWREPGMSMGYVPQEPELEAEISVEDYLSRGLFTSTEEWYSRHPVDQALQRLGLTAETRITTLSGGWKKRVALARAGIAQPHLLVLDEPTNHLDIEAIEELEQELRSYAGAVLFVTHDRRFLDRVATRIVELDRARLFSFGAGFENYQRRKAEQLAAESTHQAKFDKFLAQEEVWIRKGVEARRTRNEGRVRRLESLRVERAARRDLLGRVRLNLDAGERSGNLVAELDRVSLWLGERQLINDFSTCILRGDKIGIIGVNGAGKTSLLRLLLGQLPPQQGRVRLGTRLSVAYFDQMRSQLDPQATLAETISPGGDHVEIGGVRKHVVSYLGDFLFPPQRVRAKVESLSGGERNRLLLARLFTQPANVLVLDEPTNDLDIETLDLLESLLSEYTGTLFLVSHDRAFLDNVVTQVMVLDGQGRIVENAGGYADWQRHLQNHPEPAAEVRKSSSPEQLKPVPATTPTETTALPEQSEFSSRRARPERLSYKELRELEQLPDHISALEQQQAALANSLSDPRWYREQPAKVQELQRQQQQVDHELEAAFARWEFLEQKKLRLDV